MADRSAKRVARNESLFRSVNEAIAKHVFHDPADSAGPWLFFCECADVTCAERVRLTRERYAFVRAEPDRFVLLPEHVSPAFERVLEQGDGFAIVEKLGEAGREAAERTPDR
jgi:hypothetical protein